MLKPLRKPILGGAGRLGKRQGRSDECLRGRVIDASHGSGALLRERGRSLIEQLEMREEKVEV